MIPWCAPCAPRDPLVRDGAIFRSFSLSFQDLLFPRKRACHELQNASLSAFVAADTADIGSKQVLH